MEKRFLALLLICYLALKEVAALKNEDEEILKAIDYQYTNGKWKCGQVSCSNPQEIGCAIKVTVVKKNLKPYAEVKSKCISGKEKSDYYIQLEKRRDIEIDIQTSAKMQSKYDIKYTTDGKLTVEGGKVAPNKLSAFKDDVRKMKKIAMKKN